MEKKAVFINQDVHKALRIFCCSKGITITSGVEEAVTEYIKNYSEHAASPVIQLEYRGKNGRLLKNGKWKMPIKEAALVEFSRQIDINDIITSDQTPASIDIALKAQGVWLECLNPITVILADILEANGGDFIHPYNKECLDIFNGDEARLYIHISKDGLICPVNHGSNGVGNKILSLMPGRSALSKELLLALKQHGFLIERHPLENNSLSPLTAPIEPC